MERYIPDIIKIEHFDGSKVEPPMAVPWYPDELAWWMTTPKNVVRRFPPFAAFQKYLVSETSVGNISRQEVVSMIPPLLLDVKPHHTVLDLCAAPGSKSAQLLEMIHIGEEARIRKALQAHAAEDKRETSPGAMEIDDVEDVDMGDEGRTTGLLIANDADYKRCHMLIHQLKRLSSPNLIVTNHDATMYPSIKLPGTHNRYLKFDRILADVPCSGDGTCRKNPNLWQEWQPGNALGLFVVQVRILVRALQMLKPGGRVVYSTCSMNPVENEAVVSAAIERCGGIGKVKLLPTDDKLPKLKRKPGMSDWSIMDRSGKIWKSWADVEAHVKENGPASAPARLVEGMFPPVGVDESKRIPLEQCIRIYPHLQDTGGFFIAVLEKQSEFRAKPESDSKKIEAKPPITSIVEEILAQPKPEDGANVAPKIEAADLLSGPPPAEDGHYESAAARQNDIESGPGQTDMLDGAPPPEVDAVRQTKRIKVDEDADFAAADGDENRMVHDGPPPGAQLDLTTRPGDVRSDAIKTEPNTDSEVDIKADDYEQPAQLGKRKAGGQPQFEEPFKYIPATHSEVLTIEKFYELSPRFPRDRFLVRNAQGEPAKTIYYTSGLIRDILVENEGKGMKFVHAGIKMFMKQEVQGEGVCRWRIQAEGMPILEGYVGEERVVRLYKKQTLRKLLIEMFPKVSDGAWENLGEIGERVRDIPMGCCVLRVEPSDAEDGFDERMVLPLWRSLHSLNLMQAKEDRTAMLLRLFNETTELINFHHPAKFNPKRDPAAPPTAGPGFKVEDGEVKVDVANHSIEQSAPVKQEAEDAEIKPGPYGAIVADNENKGFEGKDVKMQKIEKGEDTGGPEQQLNGTGGFEGEVGQPS